MVTGKLNIIIHHLLTTKYLLCTRSWDIREKYNSVSKLREKDSKICNLINDMIKIWDKRCYGNIKTKCIALSRDVRNTHNVRLHIMVLMNNNNLYATDILKMPWPKNWFSPIWSSSSLPYINKALSSTKFLKENKTP